MRPHRSLNDPANVENLRQRIARLDAASVRQWGTMTPHEMVCHVADSFAAVLGDRTASSNETLLTRTIVKWIALHTSYPWPPGVPTRPEVDPKRTGTKPVEFERDRQRVLDYLQRFVAPDVRYRPHPAFGAMTHAEWMLWGYGHVDHHLRQFGL